MDTIALPEEKIAELEESLPELEAAMSYKLSDAIREGCTVTEQCVGGWVDVEGNMCALSAGLLAAKARHLL